MANRRQNRMMQESLDENLNPQAEQELRQHLDEDRRDADTFDRLKEVDSMLRTAPHERAPRTLAQSIMARVAELAQQMVPQQLSRVSGLALALGLAMAALVLIPVMIGLGALLLGLLGSGTALSGAIQAFASLLSAGLAVLELLVTQLRDFLSANPEVPLLMIALVPVSVIWLLRFLPRKQVSD